MTKPAMLVSAYVDLQRKFSGQPDYRALGKQLAKLSCEKDVVEQFPLECCWLNQFLDHPKFSEVETASNGNKVKDTRDYMVVQHEKVEWLRDAAARHPDTDVFVWVDYGIFRLTDVVRSDLEFFMKKAKYETGVSIPGCWERSDDIPFGRICWRFCGGAMVVHRSCLDALGKELKARAKRTIVEQGMIEWEVNTLARVEADGNLPFKIQWYRADHDRTMFTNY